MSHVRLSRRLLNAKETRIIQLEILQTIDDICRSNYIEYSLSGGSLLGAARHQGYIPRDDDIDIELIRPEYERLVTVLSDKRQSRRYRILHHTCDPTYRAYAKLVDTTTYARSRTEPDKHLGVYVDIFPVDLTSESPSAAEIHRREVMELRKQLRLSNPWGLKYAAHQGRVRTGLAAIVSLKDHLHYRGHSSQIAILLDKKMRQFADTSSTVTANLATPSEYQNVTFPREIWGSYVDTRFEQLTVRKVTDHDTYLTSQYGDWRTPPEEKDRKPRHSYYRYYYHT